VKDINIFCFGFGQVAKNFISKIKSKNYNISLSTTTRDKTSKKTFDSVNYQNYQFDCQKYDDNLVAKLREAEHILISIPPHEGEDIVVKNFSKSLFGS